MSTEPLPVIVVGAGPTGVAAATLLARHGVPTLVLDRWEGVFPQPRAVHLDDEVHRVLARMGAADGFAAISRPARGLRLVDRHLRVLAEINRSGPSPTSGHPRASMFDQPELEALLRANLADHPQVTLRGGVEVTGVAHETPGVAAVHLTDTATGARETLRARYVLGCDGANSTVRASVGADWEDLRFEQRWLVVDVDTDADLGQWDGVQQVCDHRRAATYMRVGGTRHRWEFQLRDGETAGAYGSLDALRPLLAPWTDRAPGAELRLVRVAEYTFRAKIADSWRAGHVFLLGDAAHLTPPFVGQGMGAGLRDAANLSWKLAGVLSGQLAGSVLDSYQAERKPHARAMIGLATLVGALMTRGGAAGGVLRRVAAPRLTLVPGLRAPLVDSATPALASAEWAERSRGNALAGRLAPNTPLPGGDLDTVVGTRWALVATEAPSPSTRRDLERRGVAVVTAEPGGALARWLSGAGARAALVRPDRTVLLSHRDVPAVCGTATRLLAPTQR